MSHDIFTIIAVLGLPCLFAFMMIQIIFAFSDAQRRKMTTYRVHFENGQAIDVTAATPNAARKIASRTGPSYPVTKVKVLRG